MNEGTPGCRAVSVSYLLNNDDAPLGWDASPWVGFLVETHRALRWVLGFRLGRREQDPQRLSQGGNLAPLNAPSPPSIGRRD